MNTATLNPVAAAAAASSSAAASLRGPGKKAFSPKGRYGPTGLAVMAAAHILLGYGLANGLAGKALEVIKKPLEATIVQEVKLPPPPPPPPPKIERPRELPKQAAPPPPAYVPPPEVAAPAAAPAAPAITAVQSTQAVAPPPAAPPAPPPAPPAPPPAPPAPVKADIALACPKQVRPEVPAKAIDEGIEGTVKAEARIRGGKVVDVRIVSGPRVFHTAVRNAMLAYQCASGPEQGAADILATQDFTFKLD